MAVNDKTSKIIFDGNPLLATGPVYKSIFNLAIQGDLENHTVMWEPERKSENVAGVIVDANGKPTGSVVTIVGADGKPIPGAAIVSVTSTGPIPAAPWQPLKPAPWQTVEAVDWASEQVNTMGTYLTIEEIARLQTSKPMTENKDAPMPSEEVGSW
jgi:hypothetical protein